MGMGMACGSLIVAGAVPSRLSIQTPLVCGGSQIQICGEDEMIPVEPQNYVEPVSWYESPLRFLAYALLGVAAFVVGFYVGQRLGM